METVLGALEWFLITIMAVFFLGLVFALIGGILGWIFEMTFLKIEKIMNKIITKYFYSKGFSQKTFVSYILFSTLTSILIGISATTELHPYLITGLIASAVPLTGILLYPPLRLRQLKAKYRRQESKKLIEP